MTTVELLYLLLLLLPLHRRVLAALTVHNGDRYDGTVVLECARYDVHRMMEVNTVLYL